MIRTIFLRALALALCAGLLGACGESAEQPMANAHESTAERVARGRYLARAADCAACHTAPGGAPFAGGVKLASPFGTFYGTNITPDPAHGIGKWSASQFYKALHDGVTPDKHLYPAMPYTSYRSMTRADSDAIYAYLMTQKPMAVPNHEPELKFPFNLRFAVMFWNVLFLKDTLPDASKGQSADWNRGRYLANALGHCAECHTPRGPFGQMDVSKTLQGSTLGQMHPVVFLSSQYLNPDDLRAMSTYLLGDTPPAPAPLPAVSADSAQLAKGRSVYLGVCAGCHGREGEGKPHVAVSMRGNSTVRLADPRNLIVTLLDGVEAAAFPGTESLQEMPGFATTLSDQELADLANFLRQGWGGQAADVSAAQVKALR
jgi:mono/diheme cytochrome c family protein